MKKNKEPLALSESKLHSPRLTDAKTPTALSSGARSFLNENKKGDIRVFVAGGSRSGNDSIYVQEAFQLGQEIAKMHYRLDFGLSSRGIMGAVAKGVLKGWAEKKHKIKGIIKGITTPKYLEYYQTDEIIEEVSEVIVAHTLEERKNQLLKADFVIFAPGGLGTLDELSYDCVSMQDGFLTFKPFILFNVHGFFHHLVEYLKEINLKGFANVMPFIVVDNSIEARIVFEMLPFYYNKEASREICCEAVERLLYDLPYVIYKISKNPRRRVATVLIDMQKILQGENSASKQKLLDEIEKRYLDKEISRMYNRLEKTDTDTATLHKKLSHLKERTKKEK